MDVVISFGSSRVKFLRVYRVGRVGWKKFMEFFFVIYFSGGIFFL